jgi:hypothetical protein
MAFGTRTTAIPANRPGPSLARNSAENVSGSSSAWSSKTFAPSRLPEIRSRPDRGSASCGSRREVSAPKTRAGWPSIGTTRHSTSCCVRRFVNRARCSGNHPWLNEEAQQDQKVQQNQAYCKRQRPLIPGAVLKEISDFLGRAFQRQLLTRLSSSWSPRPSTIP